jgi:hypothetical protein
LPAIEGLAVGAGATAAVSAAGYTLVNLGISGAVGGFIATGTIKGAALGALTAVAFYAVGNVVQATATSEVGRAVESVGLHGLVGGFTSRLAGGSFKSGFLAAGVSEALGPNPQAVDNNIEGAVMSAVAGGLGSVFGGGKFQNGAITGAFGYLFNDALHDAQMRAAGQTEVTLADGSKVWMTPDAAADYVMRNPQPWAASKIGLGVGATFVYGDILAARIACASSGVCYKGVGTGFGLTAGLSGDSSIEAWTLSRTGNPDATGMMSQWNVTFGLGLGISATYRSSVAGSDLTVDFAPISGASATATAGYQNGKQ